MGQSTRNGHVAGPGRRWKYISLCYGALTGLLRTISRAPGWLAGRASRRVIVGSRGVPGVPAAGPSDQGQLCQHIVRHFRTPSTRRNSSKGSRGHQTEDAADGAPGFARLRGIYEAQEPPARSTAAHRFFEGLLASHPSIYKRLDRAANTITGGFEDSWTFQGFSARGAVVATVRFELQQAFRDEVDALVNIETTEALGRRDNVNDIHIHLADGTRLDFDEQTAERMEPGRSVSALFSTDDVAASSTRFPRRCDSVFETSTAGNECNGRTPA
ncbi:MAG: hypothetical protein OXH52_07695 [Gammaproteobacteria bacterium]|nr:hypothetical protein [Gammaproteobacteria bacterium]